MSGRTLGDVQNTYQAKLEKIIKDLDMVMVIDPEYWEGEFYSRKGNKWVRTGNCLPTKKTFNSDAEVINDLGACRRYMAMAWECNPKIAVQENEQSPAMLLEDYLKSKKLNGHRTSAPRKGCSIKVNFEKMI